MWEYCFLLSLCSVVLSADMELETGAVAQQLVEYRGRVQFDCTKSRSGRPLRRQTGRHALQERSRQKRHILQGMARPLKQWLIRHRGNPYPTKAEKLALALGSQMTLVQVSNWFANARRRLKNTVTTPDAGWAKRIKMYNSCVVGNAELLSISSDDSIWDSEEDEGAIGSIPEQNSNADHCYSAPEGSSLSLPHSAGRKAFVASSVPARQCKRCRDDDEDSDVEASVHDRRPNKYKRTIMQRYLHDSRDHPVNIKDDPVRSGDTVECGRLQKGGDSIGSFSDSDHSSTSPSLSGSSADFRRDSCCSDDEIPYEEIQRRICGQSESSTSRENRYWREFDAAIVLISLGHRVAASANSSTPIDSGACNQN